MSAILTALDVSLHGATNSGVLFVGSDNKSLSQDSNNFNWDETNHRLGIGTSNPSYSLDATSLIRTQAGIVFPDDTVQTTASSGGSGSLTIGDSVTSGTANRILYEDSSNQLAESANLTFDGSQLVNSGGVTTNALSTSFLYVNGGTLAVDIVGGVNFGGGPRVNEFGVWIGYGQYPNATSPFKVTGGGAEFDGGVTANALTTTRLKASGDIITDSGIDAVGTISAGGFISANGTVTAKEVNVSSGISTNALTFSDGTLQTTAYTGGSSDPLTITKGISTNALTSSFISSTSSSNLLISTPDESTASTKSLIIQTGDVTGVGAGNGGSISILAGDCGLAGASSGGDVTITAGAGHPASGVGGDVTISPGGGGELTLRGPANDVAYPGISVDRIVLTNGTVTFAKSATYDSSLELAVEGHLTVDSGVTTNAVTSTNLSATSATLTNLAVPTSFTLPDGLTQNKATQDKEYSFTIDGGSGSLIATGAKKAYVRVNSNFTPSSWEIVADQSGYIKFDIWKDTIQQFPPTVADSVVGSNYPVVASAIKARGSTLTGWNTSWNKGDYLEVNVDACTSITKAILTIVGTDRSY